ncbi:MAG: gamma-glutamyltransferase [Pseudomonadota bacterium]
MIRSFALSLAILMLPVGACAQSSAAPETVSRETATQSAPGVVSAADPRAAEAGREILRAGGSATDAAMAMMLVLTVVEPQSSGIGGGGFFVRHDATNGTATTIDGRETAPSTATPELFLTEEGEPMGFRQAVPGGRSIGIPGNMRLMAEAHGRWGRLDWERLFEPAIRHAEEGYAVNARMARFLGFFSEIWNDFPDTRAIYWEDGAPKEEGDIVRNPALADLLRRLASEGADAFYSGENVAAIQAAAANSAHNQTIIPTEDFTNYRAIERAPVCRAYRSYRVCGMGPPSSGATTVLQILALLERFDMGDLGAQSPEAWHLIGEAMRLAYADRAMYLGDMDFVSVPVEGLLDDAYIAERSALISADSAIGTYEAGTPPGSEVRTAGRDGEIAGTTHFVAADSSGNVVTMTSTIEGPFGSQLVANGYFLNNELTDFDFTPERDGAPVANAVAPGKRPLSSMSPTLVYDADGQLILALGSAGGRRIIMHVAKTLIGVLDWGLPVDEAIALPNIYFGGDSLRIEQDTYLAEMQAELSQRSGLIVASNLTSKVNAIQWTGDGWLGAADPRSPGVALTE